VRKINIFETEIIVKYKKSIPKFCLFLIKFVGEFCDEQADEVTMKASGNGSRYREGTEVSTSE